MDEKREILAWTFGYRLVEKILVSTFFAVFIFGWGRRDGPWWISTLIVVGLLLVLWFMITYSKIEIDSANIFIYEKRHRVVRLVFSANRDDCIVSEETPVFQLMASPWARYIVVKNFVKSEQCSFGSQYLWGRKRLLKTLAYSEMTITGIVSDLEEQRKKAHAQKHVDVPISDTTEAPK